MTLPNDDIVQFLDGRFVLSHRNIEKDEHVGMSHGYKPTQSAVGTTNGACLLYTSPSPRDQRGSRMPSSA